MIKHFLWYVMISLMIAMMFYVGFYIEHEEIITRVFDAIQLAAVLGWVTYALGFVSILVVVSTVSAAQIILGRMALKTSFTKPVTQSFREGEFHVAE